MFKTQSTFLRSSSGIFGFRVHEQFDDVNNPMFISDMA